MKFALMIVVTCLAAANKFFLTVSEKCYIAKYTAKKSLLVKLDKSICKLNNDHIILRGVSEQQVELYTARSQARVKAHFIATEDKVAATIALSGKIASM